MLKFVETGDPPSSGVQPNHGGAAQRDIAPRDLARTTARGALISIAAQGTTFTLRTGSLIALAHLLMKEDFGLVNMVTAFTGFLALLRDAGLGMAAVQRASISKAEIAGLFWINVAVGAFLALLSVAVGPLLVAFYREPRLFAVAAVIGTSFLLNGAGAQHRAMLQRSMRFTALAIIDVSSIGAAVVSGIALAYAGHGYWALVAATVIPHAVALPGVWLATRWVPRKPEIRAGIRSMLAYGGAITLSNLVSYLATNADKAIIGRFFGAAALGVYGRAYQLINIPIENLNSTMGMVAFPALARVQEDPIRLRNYFLKGYSAFLSLVIPITVACAWFAEDVIIVFLGPKWLDAARLLRLLAPTILGFALANPFTWLMLAGGRAGRYLKISLFVTPTLIASYLVGIRYGPQGVATGFSLTMVIAAIPIMMAAKEGTLISLSDIFKAIAPSGVSIALGSIVTLALQSIVSRLSAPLERLVLECAILFTAYVLILLFVMKQKPVYAGLLERTGFVWPL